LRGLLHSRSRLFAPVARPYSPWLDQCARLWVVVADRQRRAEGERLLAECERLWGEHVADLDTLHAAQCPTCPWDGHIIDFPEA